ncbi:lysophosphatidate acyltransferase [Clonorchis sinensis]|uniref:1-acylglycerol-3-phosphate O-acyltransferase n=1 Tax=Clonorchis sinensis TaxID=79923 RepID=G7YCU4_CLOSI|nr:lysophosphatidate acyltransferase [Clonorchis sinensis]
MEKPCIYVANHQSIIDVASEAIFAVFKFSGLVDVWPEQCTIISKASMKFAGPVGVITWLSKLIYIDRSKHSDAVSIMKYAAAEARDAKVSVYVFPEGTRSCTGTMLPFKKGAFHLAVETQFPIQPIVITPYTRFLDFENKRFDDASYYVQVLPQISTTGMDSSNVDALLNETREKMSGPHFRSSERYRIGRDRIMSALTINKSVIIAKPPQSLSCKTGIEKSVQDWNVVLAYRNHSVKPALLKSQRKYGAYRLKPVTGGITGMLVPVSHGRQSKCRDEKGEEMITGYLSLAAGLDFSIWFNHVLLIYHKLWEAMWRLRCSNGQQGKPLCADWIRPRSGQRLTKVITSKLSRIDNYHFTERRPRDSTHHCRYEQKNYTVTGLWAKWTIKKPNDNQRTNGPKGRNLRKTRPLNQPIKETNKDLKARRKRPNHNRTITHKTVELNTPNEPNRHKRLTPGQIHKGPIKLGEDPPSELPDAVLGAI